MYVIILKLKLIFKKLYMLVKYEGEKKIKSVFISNCLI